MWNWFGSRKVRRQEVRKQLAQNQQTTLNRLSGYVFTWPVLLATGYCAAAIALALLGRQSFPWVVGSTVEQPIVSQVRFAYEDLARFEAQREQARAKTPSYYRLNTMPIDGAASELRDLFEAVKASESFEAFNSKPENSGWTVDTETYNAFRSMTNDAGAQEFLNRVEQLRASMRVEYTAEPRAKEDRQPPSTEDMIRVIVDDADLFNPQVTELRSLEQLVLITQTKVLEDQATRLASAFPAGLRSVVKEVVLKAMKAEPLLQFDKARTQEAMQEAAAGVEREYVPVERGEELVTPPPGQRLVLSEEHIGLLKRHEEALAQFLSSNDPQARTLQRQRLLGSLGTAAIYVFMSITLFAYMGLTRRRVLEIPTRTLAIAGLLIGTWLVVRLVDVRWPQKELLLAPILVATVILTTIYDRRFAWGVMAIHAAMILLSIGGSIQLFITTLLTVGTAALLLQEIRTRTRMVYAGALTGLVALASTVSLAFMEHQPWNYALVLGGWAGGSALLGIMVLQGVLPFIERGFGIATALTLLEWRDASKPLLQRLAREAPGTYAHSLVLSTMTEAACEAIGCNGLLTSVGALYHDIGKIPKAEYFAENQEAAINRHDRLAPTMSLLIIVGHVKDGVEMAREYGLPRALLRFIEEHHGTTLVRYFHHAAMEKQPKISSGRHDRNVSESEFRYPGPKPRSKETAILMICDGTEGIVRSLSEPTAGRIESVVHQLIMDRLNDGQFDDCDINLRELRLVEESVVKSLVRFYHGRIAYPKAGARSAPASAPLSALAEVKTSTA